MLIGLLRGMQLAVFK